MSIVKVSKVAVESREHSSTTSSMIIESAAAWSQREDRQEESRSRNVEVETILDFMPHGFTVRSSTN